MKNDKPSIKFFLRYGAGGAIGAVICFILFSNASIPLFKSRIGIGPLEYFLTWWIGGGAAILIFSLFHKVFLAKDKSDDKESNAQNQT